MTMTMKMNLHPPSTEYVFVDYNFIINWNDEDLYVAWNVFIVGQNKYKLMLMLITKEDGQVFEYISSVVDFGDAVVLGENELFIKMYSECEGVVEALIKAGVVDPKFASYTINDSIKIAKCKMNVYIPSENDVIKQIQRNRSSKIKMIKQKF